MRAANLLLQAVFARLGGSQELTALIGADGIFDRLVAGAKLPCLVLGELDSRDFSTATETGEEHLLTIEVWSDFSGRRPALEIAGLVAALLQDAVLDLGNAGTVLVNLEHRGTRSRREAKTKLFLAEVRLRAVTE
jgi:hypothetical protein